LSAIEVTTLGIDEVFTLTGSSEGTVADAETTPHLIEAAATRAVTNLLKGGT
jgi:hypothetical protein